MKRRRWQTVRQWTQRRSRWQLRLALRPFDAINHEEGRIGFHRADDLMGMLWHTEAVVMTMGGHQQGVDTEGPFRGVMLELVKRKH